jgi:3-oxoacyl-[acyl-carrier protein] reductase
VSQTVQLVVGAGGGVGAALARRLHARGDRVVLAGRTEEPVAAVAGELGTEHHVLDASDLGAVDGLVAAVVDRHGRIDGVANCAGSLLLKPAHLTTADEWAEVVATNLTTAFAVVRAAAPAMRRDGGAIALVTSAAAQTGIANHEAIAAAKAGVIGLVRSAAATYGARGVRVNAVAPGLVRTPMTERLTANEAQADASRQMHVLGRLGEPDDVASALAWLLDPANDWVTGQVLGVDGGLGQVRTRARG